MLNRYISTNKYEFNVRRIEELDKKILAKEAKLQKVNGFFNTIKVKQELKKLYKQIQAFGSEAIEYEQRRVRDIN